MRSPKCRTDESGVTLVEADVAGLEVGLSAHPPMASEGFPRAMWDPNSRQVSGVPRRDSRKGEILIAKFKSINFSNIWLQILLHGHAMGLKERCNKLPKVL